MEVELVELAIFLDVVLFRVRGVITKTRVIQKVTPIVM